MIFFRIVLITLTCVAVSYIWNYFCRTFAVKKLINLPGPRKLIKTYIRGTPDELLDILNTLGRFYPSPFQLRMNNKLFVILYEPNQIKTVLKNRHCLDRNIFYKFAEQIFGMGLLTAPESIWNKSRKIISSSFNPNMLQEFLNIFVEQSLILTDKLQNIKNDKNEIVFFEHIATCALDIVCDTMIGIKMESKRKNQYLKAVVRLKEILRYRMYSTWIQNGFLFYNIIFNLTAFGREQQKILKSMNFLINEMIQQQLHKLNKLNIIKTEVNTNHKTLLGVLMELFYKKKVTQEMIHINAFTLIAKASDTISITLDFVIFMLANFPEIQKKVYKELSEIYGTKTLISTPVKYDDLQHMHYLDQVIKETMRLFPVIPIIGRQLAEDIKIGDSILPKNTNIIIALILMNRKEEYWPNPLKFDPDRFLPERIKDCPSYYHIPFSDGSRDCIGTEYAMISVKVIVATLMRTFIFKVNESISIDKIKLRTDVVLSTIKPLKVRIEKRDL